MQKALRVAILVFPEVEVLDFAGPFEVFSVAGRVASRDRDYPFVPFEVQLVGSKGGMVRARHGLNVEVHAAITDIPHQDVIIVPGGIMSLVLGDPSFEEWLVKADKHTVVTASVCTGAFLLAKAGLLDGLVATTHWEDMEKLATLAPRTTLRPGVSWVDQGHIITSGGISAGIDMSLHLVERLASTDLANRTARQMEYRWQSSQ
jgi:transcriptional regulator GlxA family with amidase domain